ncbi:MAG: MATE family efflux transporter [Endomicrobium sp.]|jgi:putative MATE family efflux protein|nr:MATE family efflux transporter [Endomicrobium sp.]
MNTAKESTSLALGTENINKLLSQYAIPAIIAMVATSLYNVTDSIFIGHGVGALALSGLAITFPIMNLAVAFGSLLGLGAAALLSLRLGQKDYISANYILGNVFILNIIIGLLFSITALIFLDPILFFFGASNQTLPYAHDFMIIILAGNVITNTSMGFNSILRSVGHPQKAMYAAIVTTIINLVLNSLFIFKFGWGMQGSASAIVISQIVLLVWQILFFSSSKNLVHFKKGIFHLKKEIINGIFSIGMAPFLFHVTVCVIATLINKQLSFYGGSIAVGAYGIVSRVLFFFVVIIFGLNQGMQPIVGYNYGTALYGRAAEVLKKTIIVAVVVMLFGFIFVELFPRLVVSAFTSEKNLIDVTVRGLRYVFMFLPLVGFQMVVTTFFQSIGVAHKSIFLSLTRQVLFLIPLLIILPKFMNNILGVWISMPISDLIAFFVAVLMLAVHWRKRIFSFKNL